METITTLAADDNGSTSRNTINTNFSNLNTDKLEGPASAVDGNIASFDGTTGKLIKDSGVGFDGWIPDSNTWTYSSVDDPTGVVTINADLTAKISVGMRLKMTNAGNTIYGIVTAISESAGTTTLTFLHEIDSTDSLALYLLQNSAITNVYYSTQKCPFGFPIESKKWTVYLISTSNRTTNTPTSGTWYNAETISIPIGIWKGYYKASAVHNRGTAGYTSIYTTLSTANNSESDSSLTCFTNPGTFVQNHAHYTLQFTLELSSKTSYYLNYETTTTGATSISVRGDLSATVIKLLCDYL